MRYLACVTLCIGGLVLSGVSAQAFCFSGVSRTIKVGPSSGMSPLTGAFQAASVLRDKEVVLTFDDGPMAGRTDRILSILDKHCVKATFFVVGRMALANPALTKRIRSDGHTIAVHTHSHANLVEIERPRAIREIRLGYGAIQAALGGKAPAPFFRFPYLAQTYSLQKYLADQGIAVFGTDNLIMSDDFLEITPAEALDRTMAGLRMHGKGVILLHDIQPKTVRMLPQLLAALDKGGYKIVHMVPKGRVPSALALKVIPRLRGPATDDTKIATLSARDSNRAFSVDNFIKNVK